MTSERKCTRLHIGFTIGAQSSTVFTRFTFTEAHMTHNTQSPSLPATLHARPVFQELLAVGAMLATLTVVALACLLSDDSAVRARVALQGEELVLLTWAAGFVASALHALITAQRTAARVIAPIVD